MQLHAHNGSGFDTWITINNLPCDKHFVDNIKNGRSIISLRIFNGYLQKGKRQIPQKLIFKCGMLHLNYLFKKLGKTFKLQKEILRIEMNHDKLCSDTWKDEKK